MKRLKAAVAFIRQLAAAVGVAGIACLFTAYLDGDIGVVILAFLCAASFLAWLFLCLAKKKLTVALEAPAYVVKGKHFSVQTILRTSGRLPVPFVRCTLAQSANLLPVDARPFQTAVMPGEDVGVPCDMTAMYAGRGEVRVESLLLTDFIGDSRASLPQLPPVRSIAVIPEVPALVDASVLLRGVTDLVRTQDEDEEESGAMFSSVSMPGYIHRDYVPGDNLRRINWKLSAKRERLMVRMDEAAGAVRPSVILDLPTADTAEGWEIRSLLMEGALGFLLLLVQQGVACSLRFPADGRWRCLSLEHDDHVHQAAVELAAADFRSDGNRIDPQASQDKAGAFLVYSSAPDGALARALRALREQGSVTCVTSPALPVPAQADAVWHLTPDFRMTAVQK